MRKAGQVNMNKTGGGKQIVFDEAEEIILSAYKGTARMDGIPGIGETGTHIETLFVDKHEIYQT